MDNWTFGRKLAAAFLAVGVLTLVIALLAIHSLRQVVQAKDAVITDEATDLLRIERLRVEVGGKTASARAFLLSGDESFLLQLRETRTRIGSLTAELRVRLTRVNERDLLSRVEQLERLHQAELTQAMRMRDEGVALPEISRFFDANVLPRAEELSAALDDLRDGKSQALAASQEEATRQANNATVLLAVLVALTLLLMTLIAWITVRALSRQVGSAVQHLQTSSAELQAASRQQATTAQEQASATTEITTTVKELLATSRRIAETARDVVRIAEETAGAARGGGATVRRAEEGLAAIRRQVDTIVNHMLDLGRKSQQIGVILEIIDELSEQTNILAINATIEAAGAGDAGRRFGVVAEEIRRLADRVGGSSREIRSLVTEIRTASNAAAMATEEGAKASEAGTRQFGEVTASFDHISSLVESTTEAAREIELNTRQQSTAVEQVNVAMLNVSQSATEVESSSRQTVQIATELANLSRDLSRIVQPPGENR